MDDTKRIISKSILEDIADAIREKHGYNQLLKPSKFAEEIRTIEGGGSDDGTLPITVEPVLNVSYNDSITTLSWTAGDNSEIEEEYNADIEFKVTINESTVKTKNTSLEISDYLYEGKNDIIIETVSTIQTSETQENVAKSSDIFIEITHEDNQPGLKELKTKLPKRLAYASVASNGNDIYVVGGIDENLELNDIIYKYNTRTNQIEEFLQLPEVTESSSSTHRGLSNASIGIYNNNLYISAYNRKKPSASEKMSFNTYGGKYWYKINLETKQVQYNEIPQWHPTSFPRYAPRWEGNSYVAIDNFISMMDGTDTEGRVNKGQSRFNMQTETFENISTYYGSYADDGAASYYNNYIYIFGGRESSSYLNNIEKLSLNGNTRSTLTTSLPKGVCGSSAQYYDNAIYVIGGFNGTDSSVVKNLWRFNVSSETIQPLADYEFNKGICYTATTVANDNIYIFGGRDESTLFSDKIYKFKSGFVPQYLNIQDNFTIDTTSTYYKYNSDYTSIQIDKINNSGPRTVNLEYKYSTSTYSKIEFELTNCIGGYQPTIALMYTTNGTSWNTLETIDTPSRTTQSYTKNLPSGAIAFKFYIDLYRNSNFDPTVTIQNIKFS